MFIYLWSLMIESFLFFLVKLVFANQALVENSCSDTQLELVLFDLVVKELYNADVGALLLLNIDTDIPGAKLVLL